jgi:hypothetical protein
VFYQRENNITGLVLKHYFEDPFSAWPSRWLRSHGIGELIVGAHVTEKKIGLGMVLFVQNGDEEMWWWRAWL